MAKKQNINDKLKSLTKEQSAQLAASLNAGYMEHDTSLKSAKKSAAKTSAKKKTSKS